LIAINPEDPRVNELAGKKLITPIFGKEVEVVEDEDVALDFGTGIMMICTIGDKDDLEWVTRYNLNIEMGIDEEGRMTEICGKYEGLKIEEARRAIIEDMGNEGILVKQEELAQSVGGCWRCRTPVEFLQMPQWFLNVLDFKEEVLRISDEVNWFPEFMKIRLQEWVNSLSWDWVISRQRYFATSIPLWECVDCGDVILAEEGQCYIDPTIALPPLKKCSKCGGKLKGCEDVFDTWMDSSITPLYNTFWMRDEEKFKRLYPMSLRPQSHDIIRTWAFYTIIREYHLLGEKPWENIMMGGFILSPDGTPMHASLGNVIDPLPILDEYGADPIRYYAATCALGIDNQFRYQDVKRGGRLCTKLWNVEKYIGNALPKGKKVIFDEKKLNPIDKWILSKYSTVVENATEYMEVFQFDKAMKEIEFFLWHELADHYIEMVKYRIGKGDEIAQHTLYTIGLGIAKLFAPFLPHLSEEIYQEYFRSSEKDKSVHISPWPKPVLRDKKIEKKGEIVKNLISAVRNWKSEKGIPLSREIAVIEMIGKEDITGYEEDIAKTVRAKEFLMAKKKDIEEMAVRIKPIYAKIGPIFKNKANEIVEKLKSMDLDKIVKAVETNGLQIRLKDGSEVTITKDHVQVEKALTVHGREVEAIKVGDMIVLIGE
jgi:valyl-tRNA synthetase